MIEDLIQQYKQKIKELKEFEENEKLTAIQIRGTQFLTNCKIWLGEAFLGEFKLDEPVILPGSMSLSFQFEDVLGEIRQDTKTEVLIIKKIIILPGDFSDLRERKITLPWNKWGNDRYPIKIPQNVIIQALIEVKE